MDSGCQPQVFFPRWLSCKRRLQPWQVLARLESKDVPPHVKAPPHSGAEGTEVR